MTFTPIAVYFLYFIFSHPDSQLCTPQNRVQDCSSAGYQPACAVYTGGDCHSSTGLCYKTLNTACQACIDDKVIGFTLGECEQPALPQVCSKNQRGHGCPGETGEAPACGYAQPRLLRGKGLTAQQFSNNCEACRSEQFVFNVLGECQGRHALGVCGDHQTENCEEEQAEPLCAYYAGDECPDKMCRKTMRNSCNVCQESSVLFFVKGECSDNIIPSGGIRAEELIQYDTVDQSFPIKELAPVVQEDGSILYEEVKPEQKDEKVGDCYVEPQENIPELEAVVQADGTILYEIAAPKVRTTDPKEEEIIPELEPVDQKDDSIVYEEVKTPEVQKEVFEPDCVIEVQENIPELAPVVQEDGSIVYEQVSSLNTVELAAEIPKLEAILQEDGTFTYKDLKEVQKVFEGVEPQENIPELEPVVQNAGSTVYEEVKPTEVQKEVFEPDCVIEVQENIPELAPVVQEDGSILYEQVEPSKESANEEASIVPLNEESLMTVEEEKVEPLISTVSVEVIDTRLLTNEPAN